MSRPGKIIKLDQAQEDHFTTSAGNRLEPILETEGFSIRRYCFHANQLLHINGESRGGIDTFKTYVILSGKCMDLESLQILTLGDLIIIGEHEEKMTLHMLENTVILVHGKLGEPGLKGFLKAMAFLDDLMDALQEKDCYTKEHCKRVEQMTQNMALRLGYHTEKLYNLLRAAVNHDIGKIHIADCVLNKPDKLNDQEYAYMKDHTMHGKELLQDVFSPEVIAIVLQHHERLDGSGYPLGLRQDEICEEAKIIAICDSYDAMVTDRVYKKGKSSQEACAELRALSGIHYDGRLVELFIELIAAGANNSIPE